MDFTPYLSSLQGSNLDEALLFVAVDGKVALVIKGRFFLRCLCDSFSETTRIGCAVTDAESCLGYLRSERYELPYLSCPRLTPREYDVLDLLASGLTNREIAEKLVVSEETARTSTKRLLKTLEVANRVQAVLKGMRCGMIQL